MRFDWRFWRLKSDDYFDIAGPTGEYRGRFKAVRYSQYNKLVACRYARWYEKLWLWISRKKLRAFILNC